MLEGAVVSPAVAGLGAEETQIMKKSCVLRAKYVIGEEVYISPLRIVPHPLNRGGDPVKVLRCRSLTASIANHGCDVQEAEQNAVSIETPPVDRWEDVRDAGCNPDFDEHFAQHALDGHDMCIKHGLQIDGGSVSHSHLNCTLRNVQTGKVGCECARTPVVAGGGEGAVHMRKCLYLRRFRPLQHGKNPSP